MNNVWLSAALLVPCLLFTSRVLSQDDLTQANCERRASVCPITVEEEENLATRDVALEEEAVQENALPELPLAKKARKNRKSRKDLRIANEVLQEEEMVANQQEEPHPQKQGVVARPPFRKGAPPSPRTKAQDAARQRSGRPRVIQRDAQQQQTPQKHLQDQVGADSKALVPGGHDRATDTAQTQEPTTAQ